MLRGEEEKEELGTASEIALTSRSSSSLTAQGRTIVRKHPKVRDGKAYHGVVQSLDEDDGLENKQLDDSDVPPVLLAVGEKFLNVPWYCPWFVTPKGLWLAIVYFVIISDSVATNVATPFIVEITSKRFGIGEEHAGSYAGLLQGSLSLCVFLSSSFIGYLSDRSGRRLFILIGLFTNALTTLFFGIVDSYAAALFLRAFSGFTNANLALTKALISDNITEPQERATAFAYQGGAFQGARALTAALSGVTFGVILFGYDNPYFFPCVIGFLVNFVCLLMYYIWIPETLSKRNEAVALDVPMSVDSKDDKEEPGDSELHDVEGRKENERIVMSVDSEHGHSQRTTLEEGKETFRESARMMEAVAETSDSSASSQGSMYIGQYICDLAVTLALLVKDWFENLKIVMADPLLFKLMAVTAANSFGNSGILLILSTFCPLDVAKGGMGLSPKETGLVYTIFGCAAVAFQFLFFKTLYEKIGLVATYKLGNWCMFSAILSMPFAGILSQGDGTIPGSAKNWGKLIYFSTTVILCGVGFITCLPVVNVMVANAADPSKSGLIQGTVQSVASLLRGVGPIIAGLIFSLSVSLIQSPWMIFALLGIMNLICVYVCSSMSSDEIATIQKEKGQGRKTPDPESLGEDKLQSGVVPKAAAAAAVAPAGAVSGPADPLSSTFEEEALSAYRVTEDDDLAC